MKGRKTIAVIIACSCAICRAYGNICMESTGICRKTEDIESVEGDTERLMAFLFETSSHAREYSEEEIAELSEAIEQARTNPIPVNYPDESGVIELLIGGYRKASIEKYIRDYGFIRSVSELAAVPGFNEKAARAISAYITFETDNRNIRPTWKNIKRIIGYGNHELILRTTKKLNLRDFKIDPESASGYVGKDYYLYGRYSFNASDHIKAGITIEKDAGEKMFPVKGSIEPEMISGYASLENMKLSSNLILNSFIAGDYSISAGQGLCFSFPGSFFSSGLPSIAGRLVKTVRPYRSSGEINFLRGAALSVAWKNFSFSPFISYKRIDGRIEGEYYRSKPDTGIHNSVSSLKSRKTVREFITGLSFAFDNDFIHAGLNFITYDTDKKNGIKENYYNKYQLYKGRWGNISADFVFKAGILRIFGELAVDFTPDIAFIAGASAYLSERTELSLNIRGYGVGYKAPYASATGNNSSVSNEYGAGLSCRIEHAYGKYSDIFADFSYHPYFRFAVRHPGSRMKLSYRYSASLDKLEAYAAASYSADFPGTPGRLSVKGSENIKISDVAALSFREAVSADFGKSIKESSFGIMMSAGISISLGRFDAFASAAYFNSPDWNARLYIYEKDLLYTYSSRSLYGHGVRPYLYIKYKPLDFMEIWFKASLECRFGSDRLKTEYRLQARLKL